ncbi:hypothetical protein ACFLT1_05750 [Bacteroidota bacterium]
MRKLSFLLIILLTSASAIGQTNFSGKWKINRDKSELAEQFSMAPNSVEIKQEANKLDVTRNSTFQGEDYSNTSTFTLDGKVSENAGWMDIVTKSTASWSDDKKSLKVVTIWPMQDGGEMTITSIYNLKGKDLEINTTASSSFGDVTEVQVFEKM